MPLRRCTRAMGARTRFAPCALADIGRCPAPCDGRVGPEHYGELVRDLLSSLRSPDGLLGALEARMTTLAEAERFEEAARSATGSAPWRAPPSRAAGPLAARGRPAGGGGRGDEGLTFVGGRARAGGRRRRGADPAPCPRERADELSAVRSWLAHHPVRLVACDVPLAEPVDGGARIARLVRWSRDPERTRSRPAIGSTVVGAAVDLLAREMSETFHDMRSRLHGLTEAEFFWEPVPDAWTVFRREDGRWDSHYEEPDPQPAPFTTIAWRLAHVAMCKVMYHEYAYGPGRLTWPEFEPPATPEAALEMLDTGHGLPDRGPRLPRRRRARDVRPHELGRAMAGVADLLDDDPPRRPPRRRDRRAPRPLPHQ